MTISQLRYVVTVAEKGSMNEAAKSLFISQPSLTNAIKSLEEELHIRIFNRTNKGIVVSHEGDEFLGYARQVLNQADLLLDRYKTKGMSTRRFSVSTQHYSFAVNAFVELIEAYGEDNYDFTIRETQTNEIIQDVSHLKSEIGVLYLSNQNETVIKKLLKINHLDFEELYVAKPHVFISDGHPLAGQDKIELGDLMDYPYLSFEQGEYNSFYFSEEIISTLDRKKNIKVRDRATLFNLLIGLNGYTVSSGVIDEKLNGPHIIARPLMVDEEMHIGVITHKKSARSDLGALYLEALRRRLK